ncbi:MAG: hypothetical protein AABX47_08065 [Nanoarchaeota archaeon]
MRPEQKFKAGGVEATVWKNKSQKDGGESEYFSVGFTRSYKDKGGSWKTTNSLAVHDIPKAIAVLGKAYEWCVMKRKDDGQAAEA